MFESHWPKHHLWAASSHVGIALNYVAWGPGVFQEPQDTRSAGLVWDGDPMHVLTFGDDCDDTVGSLDILVAKMVNLSPHQCILDGFACLSSTQVGWCTLPWPSRDVPQRGPLRIVHLPGWGNADEEVVLYLS